MCGHASQLDNGDIQLPVLRLQTIEFLYHIITCNACFFDNIHQLFLEFEDNFNECHFSFTLSLLDYHISPTAREQIWILLICDYNLDNIEMK